MKMSRKVVLWLSIQFLLAVSLIAVVINMHDEQKDDGLVINIAGRQRMLSQKMMKEALLFSQGEIPARAVAATIALFRTSLAGLVSGGPVPVDLEQTMVAELPETKTTIILEQLKRVEGLSIPFLENMEVFLNTRNPESLTFLKSHEGTLLSEIDRAVRLMDVEAARKVRVIHSLLVAGTVAFALLYLAIAKKVNAVNTLYERNNAELKGLNTDHANLLANLDSGVIFLDRTLRVRKYNPAATTFFTLQPRHGGSANHRDVEFAGDEAVLNEIHRVLETGLALEREERGNGDRWMLLKILPFHGQAGEVEGIVLTCSDITVIKEAEQQLRQQSEVLERRVEERTRQLRESEHRFRQLADSLPQLVWTCTLQGQCDFLSKKWIAYTGIPEEAQLGIGWLEQVHPEDRGPTMAAWEAAVASGADLQIEFRIRGRDGLYRWFDTRAIRLPDSAGNEVKWFGSNTDITERKAAEQVLRQSESKYRTLVESIPQKIFYKDRDSTFIACNGNFARDLGLSTEEVAGRTDFDFFPRELAEKYRADDLRIMASGATEELDEGYLQDGRERIVHTIKTPVYDNNEVTGVMGVFWDVTERRQAEEKLKQTLADLERSNKELEQFAYVASHDLQEPLRMVTSYMQLIERRYRGKLDADADEFIAFAVDGANRMKMLINDLLTYSRVGTRGKELVPTDSGAVLRRVLDDLQLAIGESGATVTFDPLPMVLADAIQLAQLFQNLIGNALKFHNKNVAPVIHISTHPALPLPSLGQHRGGQGERVCEEARRGLTTFVVRDNGIGFDAQFSDRIFIIFQRLHTKEEYEGTGIGLAICKKIVERHGGRIWVESYPGQGSTFHFTLQGA